MLAPMGYELTLEQHPAYLHATARGDRTAGNASRFLREAYAACTASGSKSLLLDMRLAGPPLPSPKIFEVISEGSRDGMKLRKIAYVDIIVAGGKTSFAETVARNRGVNVRLFPDIAAATRWLNQQEEEEA